MPPKHNPRAALDIQIAVLLTLLLPTYQLKNRLHKSLRCRQIEPIRKMVLFINPVLARFYTRAFKQYKIDQEHQKRIFHGKKGGWAHNCPPGARLSISKHSNLTKAKLGLRSAYVRQMKKTVVIVRFIM